MTKRKASRRRVKSRPMLDDEEPLRLAALQLLLCALDPIAPPDAFTEAALKLVDVVEIDGKRYVDAQQLQDVLQHTIIEARNLVPEQPPAVEAAIDAGFDEIADEVDRVTRPKALRRVRGQRSKKADRLGRAVPRPCRASCALCGCRADLRKRLHRPHLRQSRRQRYASRH